MIAVLVGSGRDRTFLSERLPENRLVERQPRKVGSDPSTSVDAAPASHQYSAARDGRPRSRVPRRASRAAGWPDRAAIRGAAPLSPVLRIVAQGAATGSAPDDTPGV